MSTLGNADILRCFLQLELVHRDLKLGFVAHSLWLLKPNCGFKCLHSLIHELCRFCNSSVFEFQQLFLAYLQTYTEDDFFQLFPEEVRPWDAMLLWGTEFSRSTLHIDPYNWTGTNAVIRGRKRWKVNIIFFTDKNTGSFRNEIDMKVARLDIVSVFRWLTSSGGLNLYVRPFINLNQQRNILQMHIHRIGGTIYRTIPELKQ